MFRKSTYSVAKRMLSLALALLLVLPAIMAAPQAAIDAEAAAAPAAAEGIAIPRPGILAEADRGLYETLLDVAHLNKVGHIMYIAAHPDDEGSNGLFSYIHDNPRYNIEVSYAVSNFGEGGEDGIGPELAEGLGVIRSQELKSAAAFDRKTQYYLGSFDSSYCPSLDVQIIDNATGTKGLWDPNVYTYNIAKLLRLTRPDIVIDGHSDSGHAQHVTAYYFTQIGVMAAKDPAYVVYADDGVTKLDPWTVSRVVYSGGNTAPNYYGHTNPYYTSFTSFDAKGISQPSVWTNFTYGGMGTQAYGNHISQNRTGFTPNPSLNNTASGFTVAPIAALSAPGMSADGWELAAPNSGTLLAGIDVSTGRINTSLDAAGRAVTDALVNTLKTRLDNIVAKFPNGPAADIMIAEGAPAGYNKAPGTSSVATVEAQIAAVSDDLMLANVALTTLENWAAANTNITGWQTFDFFLRRTREHLDTFVNSLYGIHCDIEIKDANGQVIEDIYPGQTITVTAKLTALASQVQPSKLSFPTAMMNNGKPTVISVPEYATVTPVGTPVPLSGLTGKIYGGDLPVGGYQYTYTVTLGTAAQYSAFTGPYNAPHDQAYNKLINPAYPYGATTNYNPNDWIFTRDQPTSNRFSGNIATTAKPTDGTGLKTGIMTALDHPYAIPPIVGLAKVQIGTGMSYGVYAEPVNRLVPALSVTIDSTTEAVMLRKDENAQSTKIIVHIENNMDRAVTGLSLTFDTSGETQISVAPVTGIDIPAGGSKEIEATVSIAGNFTGSAAVTAVASFAGETYRQGYQVIDYTPEVHPTCGHFITKQYMYKPSAQKLAVAEYGLKSENLRIGFAASGVDDYVFDYIKNMYKDPENALVEKIGATELALGAAYLYSKYDTIVVGKTAYGGSVIANLNLRADNGANAKNLLDFANLGGNLVVHYQNVASLGGSTAMNIVPVPFSLQSGGPGNLNLPHRPIYVPKAVETHDFYNVPTKINLNLGDPFTGNALIPDGYAKSGSSVWDGWVNQFAEWAPSNVDAVTAAGYTVLLAGNDTDSQRLRPGIEYMDMDNGGTYTYSSVIWDRQLQNLVAGAYQLYANLLSLGYEEGSDVDKTMLAQLIEEALEFEEEDFRALEWGIFEEALTLAQTVYANNSATQEEVDEAVQKLSAAIEILKEQASVRIILTGENKIIRAGDYFNIHAAFENVVNGNAAVLDFKYDTTLFEYANCTPSAGVTVLKWEVTATGVRLTLMIDGYQAKDLLTLMLLAKETVDLGNDTKKIAADVDIVIKDAQGNKKIVSSAGSTTITTGKGTTGGSLDGDVNGDGVVDLIDLSDIIDAFGYDDTHPDWPTVYLFMDYNQNKLIDISDIGYVASRIVV